MEDTKNWYASRAVWGGIIAAVAAAVGMFGYHVMPADQAAIIDTIAGGAGVVGGVVAIYGRIVASKKIGT